MQLIVENIIVLAAIYALLACGYVLIYRVSRGHEHGARRSRHAQAYLLYTSASLFVGHQRRDRGRGGAQPGWSACWSTSF